MWRCLRDPSTGDGFAQSLEEPLDLGQAFTQLRLEDGHALAQLHLALLDVGDSGGQGLFDPIDALLDSLLALVDASLQALLEAGHDTKPEGSENDTDDDNRADGAEGEIEECEFVHGAGEGSTDAGALRREGRRTNVSVGNWSWRGRPQWRRAYIGPPLCRSLRRGPSAFMVALCALFAAVAWPQGAVAQDRERFGGCPRVSFRAMFEAAADHDEVGDLAAIERDALALCVRRQELINEIVAGEETLVAFIAKSATEPSVRSVAEVDALPAKAVSVADAVPVVDPEPVTDPEPVVDPGEVIVVPVREEPELSWTVVYGGGGEWIAGITDGMKVWYVRPGDELPSGVRVVSVRLRPPGVKVRIEGDSWFLPGPRDADGPGG